MNWVFLKQEEALKYEIITSEEYNQITDKYSEEYLNQFPGLYGFCKVVLENYNNKFYTREQKEFLANQIYSTKKAAMEIADTLKKIRKSKMTQKEEIEEFFKLFEIKDDKLKEKWLKMAEFNEEISKIM